jgi:ribosomal protein S27AE
VEKNTCPHCGAWGQLSKFCNRCGNSIIYSSIKKGQADFSNKPITPSTQKSDVPIIIFYGFMLTIIVATIIGFFV